MREWRQFFSPNYWRSALFIAKHSLRDQFKNSFLGMGWALIQPLVYVLILSVVMSIIFRMPLQDYSVYVMFGVLPWQYLVGALTKGAGSFANRRGIFHHTPLPKTMFVMADSLMQLYLFLIAITVAFIVSLFITGFSPSMLLLPFTIIPLIVTSMAGAVMFAYISAYVWDTPHILYIAFQSLIWTVPIMYPISMVPEKYQIYFQLNPLYMLLHPIQMVMYERTIPGFLEIAGSCGVTALTCALAYSVYRKLRQNVIYYL